jgi:hypothetical protein
MEAQELTAADRLAAVITVFRDSTAVRKTELVPVGTDDITILRSNLPDAAITRVPTTIHLARLPGIQGIARLKATRHSSVQCQENC